MCNESRAPLVNSYNRSDQLHIKTFIVFKKLRRFFCSKTLKNSALFFPRLTAPLLLLRTLSHLLLLDRREEEDNKEEERTSSQRRRR